MKINDKYFPKNQNCRHLIDQVQVQTQNQRSEKWEIQQGINFPHKISQNQGPVVQPEQNKSAADPKDLFWPGTRSNTSSRAAACSKGSKEHLPFVTCLVLQVVNFVSFSGFDNIRFYPELAFSVASQVRMVRFFGCFFFFELILRSSAEGTGSNNRNRFVINIRVGFFSVMSWVTFLFGYRI